MRYVWVIATAVVLVGCDRVNLTLLRQKEPDPVLLEPVAEEGVSVPEEVQDISIEAREEVPRGALGTTVVSLGAASEPGLWLKTPLVAKSRPGVVRWNGGSVEVTLIPIEGQSGAGSRMSLAAMQALGIPLTALEEVSVEAR
ncbi:hypothetical protein [Shimia abyssi]|uniref:Uncharacterized protein n=1 Tax=Shimia abyssi TaxID=1662395 RepID=A0A2P8FJG4_9RHOB|nr:hypothetical protein [Shimia abyssi]PSL21881.1 hypothetical protein CLV88_101305 [Shimia abyssi]